MLSKCKDFISFKSHKNCVSEVLLTLRVLNKKNETPRLRKLSLGHTPFQ